MNAIAVSDDAIAAIKAGLNAAIRRRHGDDAPIPEAMMSERSPRQWQPMPATFAEGHTGLLVALWLDAETAGQLAIDGGEPADNLHITLCYCGNVDALGELAVARAIVSVENELRYQSPLAGRVAGMGRFQATDSSDNQDVIWAAVDIPGLIELRQTIDLALSMAGCTPSTNHGWTPHLTLAYVDGGAAMPAMPPDVPLRFDAVTVAVGDRRVTIPMSMAGGTAMVYAEPWSIDPGRGIGRDGKRVFQAWRFDGAPEWVPYLPKPGVYDHPIYGTMHLTADHYDKIVANFQAGIYQSQIPVGAEHKTSVSGALGWGTDMRVNGDGSIDLKVEWTERGRSMLADNRFKYVSAEFFEYWTDPATDQTYEGVAIGHALVTQPYFKENVLRPLAASESGALDMARNPRQEDTSVSDQNTTTQTQTPPAAATTLSDEQAREFAELKAARETMVRELAEAKAANEAAASRIAVLETENRRKRFTDLAMGRGGDGDGAAWVGGGPERHVSVLMSLAEAVGEESDAFTGYIESQKSAATALKEANLFSAVGTGREPAHVSAWDQIDAKARELKATDATLTIESARVRVMSDHPDLARAYKAERRNVTVEGA